MKTNKTISSLLLAATLTLFLSSARAQNLVFNNPTLVSGTPLQLGAVYKFPNAVPYGYAMVTIDSLVNGATVGSIDDNTAGTGYLDALQPTVTIPGSDEDDGDAMHEAYAVFKIDLYYNSNNIPYTLDIAQGTALDIDGNANLKELAEINMGGGLVSYMSTTLDIVVTNILGLKFRGDNIAGIERPGIDTSALGNMFTVTKSGVTSFKVKFGAKSTLTTSATRQFSLYMKGFNYPSQITLPVKLLDFEAKYTKPDVSLTWRSSQEINFNYYLLEHSSDGNTYSTTCLVFGAGVNGMGAAYNYRDKSVEGRSGIIYYRLKMVDNDGRMTYSPVKIVRLNQDENKPSLVAYPNPVSNELKIMMPAAWVKRAVQIDLFNVSGQKLKSYVSSNAGAIEFFNTSDLRPGVYFLQASCGIEIARQQIVKN
jgi:hypothetical protein